MKNFTFKSVLAAAALLLGTTGSWADTFNGTVDFVAKSRSTYAEGIFTTANNAGNGYALAIADLSSLENIASATSVTLAFDAEVKSGGRLFVGIGDKNTRGENANGSSKSTYNKDGLIMYYGTSDGTYVRVNGGTNNSAAMGVTSHIVFTLDRVNGTYSYTITDSDTEDVLFSASNLTTDVNSATIIEVYSWVGNQSTVLSSVSYSYEYSASSFDYTIKAVTSDEAEIKTLASGTSDEAIYYYFPYAFLHEDVWYTTEEPSYVVEATSLNPNINIVYAADNSIKAFVEGESSKDATEGYDAKYSLGKYGYVPVQNYQVRGISLGHFTPGNYKLVVKVVANAFRGICVRNSTGNNSSNEGCITWAATDNASLGVQTVDFELTEERDLILNGKDSGTKSNQSADFDYAMILDMSTPVPTGIASVNTQVQDNVYFNMAGQRVAQPAKGLYIVNGKKVLLP